MAALTTSSATRPGLSNSIWANQKRAGLNRIHPCIECPCDLAFATEGHADCAELQRWQGWRLAQAWVNSWERDKCIEVECHTCMSMAC